MQVDVRPAEHGSLKLGRALVVRVEGCLLIRETMPGRLVIPSIPLGRNFILRISKQQIPRNGQNDEA